MPPPAQTNLEDTAYLYAKDSFVPGSEAVEGRLRLNNQELKFTSVKDDSVIVVPLPNINDADFTNIFAKVHFIISTTNNKRYIFGFAPPMTGKRTLMVLIRPFNNLLSLIETTENVQKAEPWKVAFQQLTPKVFRTRKEIDVKNIIIGSLISVAVLAVFLVGLVMLLSR